MILQAFSATGALGDVVTSEFNVHAARVGAQTAVHLKVTTHFVDDIIEASRLLTTSGLDGVAVHRIADPHDVMTSGGHLFH